jgi:hypothetical protein
MKSSYTQLTLSIMLIIVLLVPLAGISAQDGEPTDEGILLPSLFALTGFNFEHQQWNNCGPATLTNALSYFGYASDQVRAADWLKPHYEDKNVSPWQMAEFVNTQVPEIPVYALYRYGGTLDMLKTLLFNGFPVIIESGYDPVSAGQGWMGHYLLIYGYDDDRQVFLTYDSYDGPELAYSYQHIQENWQHFNYVYIVPYLFDNQARLFEVLGSNADEYENLINTLTIASSEASLDTANPFAWFNIGSTLVMIADRLGEDSYYQQAVLAYDNARNLGLPWRMLWYQFGMYEAYLAMGRYDDVIALANQKRDDGGGNYVEETFYYAGLAREAMGDTERAINNYTAVVNFNPNFHPAQERLNALLANGG